MSRLLMVPFLAAGLLVLGSAETEARQAAPAAVDDPSAVITAENIHNRIYFLASDGLRGRDTPSPGLEAAAAYIVSEYRRMGIEPAGEDGYYQRYPFELRGADLDASRLEVAGPGGTESLAAGREFFAMGGTDGSVSGPVRIVQAPPEDVGAGELDGAIAVFPLPGEWGQQLFQQSGQQAGVAQEGGARAVIHVLDDEWTESMIEDAARQVGQPSWTLGNGETPFPRFFVRAAAAERAFEGAGGSLESLLAQGGTHAAAPSDDLRVEADLPLRVHDRADPPNIAGMVRGSDPELRDEYVVLSAHVDHVGVGQPQDGDSIYNGADDNASGTAALLEIGAALVQMPEAPRRSIILLHVSGEEKGLLGSRWWADNPTVPIENVVANINTDMVAGDPHPDTVMIIGKEYSELGGMVREINESMPELGLVASPDLMPEQRLFYRSDQYNFMRKEIPSLFFFTGLHECYHRPCDTVDFIDPEKGARVARLAFLTALEIANRDARPEWDPEGLAEVREMTR